MCSRRLVDHIGSIMFIVFNTLVAAYIHHQGMFKIQAYIYVFLSYYRV